MWKFNIIDLINELRNISMKTIRVESGRKRTNCNYTNCSRPTNNDDLIKAGLDLERNICIFQMQLSTAIYQEKGIVEV